METIKKVSIKLRRDTVNNYASHSNHIPLKGEVCIVDPTFTTSWSKVRNIRVKIGDGITTFGNLPFVDEQCPSLIRGFYNNGKFYLDAEHTDEITDFDELLLYLDLHKGIIYYYDGTKLVANVVEVPSASAEQPGVMRLYKVHGDNEDGTMTQKAITDAINAIQILVDEDDNEMFYLGKPW